jgi:hypothetical protein
MVSVIQIDIFHISIISAQARSTPKPIHQSKRAALHFSVVGVWRRKVAQGTSIRKFFLRNRPINRHNAGVGFDKRCQ